MLGLSVLLAIFIGVGFFVTRNFDPDSARAKLEQIILRQTGFHAEIGNIKLAWGIQPEFRVDSLKLFRQEPQNPDKILQCKQVRVCTDLVSIWNKRFLKPRVMIQGLEIHLERKSDGSWNWMPKASALHSFFSGSSETSVSPSTQASQNPDSFSSKLTAGSQVLAGGWLVGVGEIEVVDGNVHLMDKTIQPAFSQKLERLTLVIKPKPFRGIFYFTASGSVLNAAGPNLEVQGDLDLISKSLNFDLQYGPEKLLSTGVLQFAREVPHFEGQLEIRSLDLDSVIPEVYKSGGYMNGLLSAKTRLSFDGFNTENIKSSLKGEGSFEIREGAYKNRNLIKEVFDRLSSVITTTQELGGVLPPEVTAMIKGADTPFQILNLSYAVMSGEMLIHDAYLVHSDYQVTGKGAYGIQNQRVDSSMQLVFSKSISAYLVHKIHEMEFLSDRNGQVMIPFRYSGILPNASVQPDLQYVTNKLLQAGAEQFLSRGLEKLAKFLEPKK